MPTTTMDANTVVKNWPEDSRTVMAALISKYGPTDEVTPTLVTWRDRGPWKKLVASKVATPHNFPFPRRDVVENFTEMTTVAQARQTYVDTMLAFREKKPTPYMIELQFKRQPKAGDPDTALVSIDQLKQAAKERKTTIPVGQEDK